MTTTQQVRQAFRVRAIDPLVLAQLRVLDDAGHAPRMVQDAEGGSPLRCCLRRSRPGERIALVSYAPLRRWAAETGADPGPYDEVGPVFVHPEPCDGPVADGFPAELAGLPRMLRSYSADGRILDGRLAGGDDLRDQESARLLIEEILADPRVAVMHARAVDFGCFTFEIQRAG
ncbi:MAG TPA: DUF1203 domain-containing protein [Streptosporangiaceae bacterium]